MQYLRRYFNLIIFQAYLRSTPPDNVRSFETFDAFVKSRPGEKSGFLKLVQLNINIMQPVFKTFEKEFRTSDANILKPLERIEVEEGYATKDEVDVIVANRSGAILSASTMLKSDLFTNLQKVYIQLIALHK